MEGFSRNCCELGSTNEKESSSCDEAAKQSWAFDRAVVERTFPSVADKLEEAQSLDFVVILSFDVVIVSMAATTHAGASCLPVQEGANPNDAVVLLHNGDVKRIYKTKSGKPIYRETDKLFDLVHHS